MDRKCKGCNEIKPLIDFYKHQKARDCRMNKCKECVKAAVRANRLINLEYYREYDRKRGNRQGPDYQKNYRRKNQIKYKAHSAVGNAVRDGRLLKSKNCENCDGTGAIHGHHDDYTKPLEVRWLCAACHRQWHVKHGEAKPFAPLGKHELV